MTESQTPEYLDTSKLQPDLKRLSIKGGAFTITEQAANLLIRTGSTMVLARILVPEDFGLVAMVAILVFFAHIFTDFGLSTASVQRSDLTEELVNSLFWVNVGLGLVVAVLLAASADLIASFYGDSRLVGISLVLSLSFVFGGLTTQHQALLKRQMLFKSIAIVNSVSFLLGAVVGIAMAAMNFHYWSLVFMVVSASFFKMVGTWIACEWRPGIPHIAAGSGSMIRFGTYIALRRITNFFARKADNILIGKMIGANALGLYAKAYDLVMLPINQIRLPIVSVALPGMSSIQDQKDRSRNYYKRMVLMIAFLSMPLMVFTAICADQLVYVILGEKWLSAIPLFRVLSIAAFIQPVTGTLGVVLITAGLTRRHLFLGILNAGAMVTSFIVGLKWGTIGVASSYAAMNYLVLLPFLYFSFRGTYVRVSDFFLSIKYPFLFSVGLSVSLLLLRQINASFPLGISLATNVLGAVCVYVGVWLAVPTSRDKLYALLGDIKALLMKSG
jgi:O-antigen/teichoic acid export membrane protein